MTDANFKITLQILQVLSLLLTPKFHSNSVSVICEEQLQCIAPVMQGLLTSRSSHLQNQPYILPEFEKLNCSGSSKTMPEF